VAQKVTQGARPIKNSPDLPTMREVWDSGFDSRQSDYPSHPAGCGGDFRKDDMSNDDFWQWFVCIAFLILLPRIWDWVMGNEQETRNDGN
jgi:hypothetical protein